MIFKPTPNWLNIIFIYPVGGLGTAMGYTHEVK